MIVRIFYGIEFDLISLIKLIFMKTFAKLMLITTVLIGFTNCSSAQKLEKQISFKIGEVYYQHWVAGIQGGGSGINIFIPIDDLDTNIQLDSVYFRGKAAKLEFKSNFPTLFMGRFISLSNNKKEIIMSDNPKDEYTNKLPPKKENIPFELKPNECVISYLQEGKTKFYKIGNVIEKKTEFYPSAPPRKQ